MNQRNNQTNNRENIGEISNIIPHNQTNSFLSEDQDNILDQMNQNNQEYEQDPFENEKPLLEEIGIDLNMIKRKFIKILTFQSIEKEFLENPDMIGPLILTTLLGRGKFSFGFIYGFGFFGSVFVYFYLNLMMKSHIQLYDIISILGYCIEPVILAAFLSFLIEIKTSLGIAIAICCAILSTIIVIKFLKKIQDISHKKYILAYPVFLFYVTFVILIVS